MRKLGDVTAQVLRDAGREALRKHLNSQSNLDDATADQVRQYFGWSWSEIARDQTQPMATAT